MMMRYHKSAIALLLLATALSACGGDSTAPPTTGTLVLKITTTGVDIDSDGYLFSLDGHPAVPIDANGTFTLSLPPGIHTWTLHGLAFNCDVASPDVANIDLGKTTTVNLTGTCAPYLRNVIIYTSEEFAQFGEITVVRPDGSRRERLTVDQAVYAAPVVSPDGQTIAAASRLGGSWSGIYLFDRFGKNRTLLVSHSTFDGTPAWSPDGSRLAFRSEVPGPYGAYGRIFIVNRNGTGLRQLSPETVDYTYDDMPSWSPDGLRIVFTRNGELHYINVDGSGLTDAGVQGQDPSWSPDGTRIVYASFTGNDGIWWLNVGSTVQHRLTPSNLERIPRWSPDGQKVVFQRSEGSVLQLYTADINTFTKLSQVAKNEGWPSWTPNF